VWGGGAGWGRYGEARFGQGSPVSAGGPSVPQR
jgi:hypothetical protein